MKIYLLRHGKVEGEPALYGSTDVPVSADIIEQMAQALKRGAITFDLVVSSPLQRCSKLADKLHAEGEIPMMSMAGFREMDFGLYDGQPFEQLKDEWTHLERFWQDPAKKPLPDAECLADFEHRVIKSWNELLCIASMNQWNEHSILLITHGGVIRVLISHILGIDSSNPKLFSHLKIGNASVTTIDHSIYQHDGAEEAVTTVESIALPLR